MAEPTPFHPRTSELCRSQDWRHWAGYCTPATYDEFSQPEYAAIRHAAALIDISPLYKYRIEGPQAADWLQRVITHDLRKLRVGRVLYTPWCDPDGKVRQEGTVFRLAKDRYQICAAEPALGWLRQNRADLDAELYDDSAALAGLSLQGPLSRDVLRSASTIDIDRLKFFRLATGEIAGVPVTVSRTGYTGDLGYEIWLPAAAAVEVWDALIRLGEPFRIRPCGLAAMDIARVEAGFVLIDVDYTSSELAKIEAEKSSPFELGLGWAVRLDKGPFIGREALVEEKRRGSEYALVGLQIDWQPLEDLYLAADLMPDLPLATRRDPVPVFAGSGGPQIGRATSRVWSTRLKKYLALATVEAAYARPGTAIAMEVTVHWERKRAPARVVELPFFRPERMKA